MGKFTFHWQPAGAVGLLVLAITGSASASLYPRGDATCSAARSADDMVATVLGLGGASSCNNDDCDRDGAVTPADVDCAARCLFGACPVPANAARVTAIMPDSAPDVVPSSVVRIAVANLGPPDTPKRVTIGGLEAEIVDEGDGEILVALPLNLRPGPVDLIVIIDDVAGAPTVVEVGAPLPIGAPDTFDGALGLVDEAIRKLLTLDLESAYPDDPATVRDGLTAYLDELAEQRTALANDPDLTAADRLALDAAMDASGAPEMLRALIVELEAVGAPAGAEGGPAQSESVLLAARAVAKTVEIVAGVVRTTAAVTATGVGTGISTPAIIAIGVGLAIGGTAIYVAGNLPTPVIFSATYANARSESRPYPTAGGFITLKGKRFDARLTTLQINARGIFYQNGMNQADGGITYPLPDALGFCGPIIIALSNDNGRYVSNQLRTRVQPELLSLDRSGNPGGRVDGEVRGIQVCYDDVDLSFEGVTTDFNAVELRGDAHHFASQVPPVIPGTYSVSVTAQGVRSPKSEDILYQVGNALSGVKISCPATITPGSAGRCVVTDYVPSRAPRPFPSRWVWTSNRPARVAVEASTTSSETQLVVGEVGTAKIKVALETTKGPRMVLATSPDVQVEVIDTIPPTVSIASSATSPVEPGSSIPVTVTVSDNNKIGVVQLITTGDAVANGQTQESIECIGKKTCTVMFTVNLRTMDFTQSTVTIQAAAVDASLKRGASSTLSFAVAKDTMCPTVTIQQPEAGGTVNAGQTTAVSAIAHDDGPTDTGVKTFTYSATGPALTATVSQTLDFPAPLKAPTLHFNFTVKQPSELIGVEDRNITISVAAADAAMPPNVCPPQIITVGVVGVLDTCDGGITTDNPAGYIDEPFTITVVLAGEAADEITRVTSVNPGGSFDLDPQGGGVYTVTLFYQGEGGFTLSFIASDANGMERCAGSINLESLGPAPDEAGEGLRARAAAAAGGRR